MSRKDYRFTKIFAATAITIMAWRRMNAERKYRYHELNEGSKLIDTSLGTVEVGERGSGDPVLVIHGALGNYEHALNYAELLVESGYRIIAPSRPGHQRTAGALGKTVNQQADLLASVLDEMEIERLAVVSVSGGGPVAIAFAAKYPERCSSLTLINAVTETFDPFRLTVARTFQHVMQFVPAPDFLAWLLTRAIVHTLPIWSRFKPEFERLITKNHDNLRLYKRATGTFFPIQDVLEGFEIDLNIYAHADRTLMQDITAPTMIVYSKTAKTVPPDHAHAAKKMIPDIRVLALDEAGHAMHLTHAQKIWDSIVDFIEQTRTKPTHTEDTYELVE